MGSRYGFKRERQTIRRAEKGNLEQPLESLYGHVGDGRVNSS